MRGETWAARVLIVIDGDQGLISDHVLVGCVMRRIK